MEIFVFHLANSSAIIKYFHDPRSHRSRLFPCLLGICKETCHTLVCYLVLQTMKLILDMSDNLLLMYNKHFLCPHMLTVFPV